MNIQLPPILMFTRGFLGFDPQPHGLPTSLDLWAWMVAKNLEDIYLLVNAIQASAGRNPLRAAQSN